MTFIVNHDGVVYQKDLGRDTAKVAEAMTDVRPGPDLEERSIDRLLKDGASA